MLNTFIHHISYTRRSTVRDSYCKRRNTNHRRGNRMRGSCSFSQKSLPIRWKCKYFCIEIRLFLTISKLKESLGLSVSLVSYLMTTPYLIRCAIHINVWTLWIETINPLNAELNPICYLLALLGAHHFLHVSRIRVKSLTLRQLIYIYIWSTYSWCF